MRWSRNRSTGWCQAKEDELKAWKWLAWTFASLLKVQEHYSISKHFRGSVREETWSLRDMILGKKKCCGDLFVWLVGLFCFGFGLAVCFLFSLRSKQMKGTLWLPIGTNYGLWICVQCWSSSGMLKLLQILPHYYCTKNCLFHLHDAWKNLFSDKITTWYSDVFMCCACIIIGLLGLVLKACL